MRLSRARGRSLVVLVVVAVVASLLAAIPAAGAATQSDTGYVIVELTSPAAAHSQAMLQMKGRFDPDSPAYAAYKKHLENEHANFRAALGKKAPGAAVVREYFVTANAVAVKLNGTKPSDLKKLNSVKDVYEDGLYKPLMDQSLGLIEASEGETGPAPAQAGAGIKVGVIDSGIDADHPFFQNCPGFDSDNPKVVFGGVYYSGEGILPQVPSASAIVGPNYTPGPGDPFYFSSTHGTHVAGTIGGCVATVDGMGSLWDGTTLDGTELSGVAPAAQLWDYNVFPFIGAGMVAFGGSALSHDIAAAIEDAVADDMDVINMSLGGGVQGPHDFLAEVSNAAVDAGVVVVVSAGNEGPDSYTIGSPGSAEKVVTVGASTNTRGMRVPITITKEDSSTTTYSGVPGEFPDFDQSVAYLIVKWPGSDPEACSIDDVPSGTYGDSEVVIIARGSCSFSQKVANAKAAGAAGAIIYTQEGALIPIMGRSPEPDDELPAVAVSYEDGQALLSAASVPAMITPPTIVAQVENLLAGFSSRGPAPFTDAVKPDVVAPGVDILSSVISFTPFEVTGTGWDLFSGTSMASPHVAGAAAVLLWKHKHEPDRWTPAMVKSALANNAFDLGYTAWEQGGGLINLPSANDANVFFEPSNASFGLFEGKKPANGSVEIAITNGVSCSVESVTGSTHAQANLDSPGTVLTVEFNGGRTAGSGFYDGVVTVTCDGRDYTIPWGAVVDRKG